MPKSHRTPFLLHRLLWRCRSLTAKNFSKTPGKPVHQAEQEAQARAAAALVCLACVWHTSSREKALLFRSRDTTGYSTCSRQGDITVRETPGWRRHRGWLVVLLTVLMLGAGYTAAAEPKKFTLINVVLDGTKIWLTFPYRDFSKYGC